MTIYGLGLLSLCFIIGQVIGLALGRFLDIDANVGGVGFSMLFLILLGDWMKKKQIVDISSNTGVSFWNEMYIPIIVAMSATQDVHRALSSGWLAVIVGIIPTGSLLFLVPTLTKMSRKNRVQ